MQQYILSAKPRINLAMHSAAECIQGAVCIVDGVHGNLSDNNHNSVRYTNEVHKPARQVTIISWSQGEPAAEACERTPRNVSVIAHRWDQTGRFKHTMRKKSIKYR
jgi:hypothetical protein